MPSPSGFAAGCEAGLCPAVGFDFWSWLCPWFGLCPANPRAEPEPGAQPRVSGGVDGGAEPRLTSGGEAGGEGSSFMIAAAGLWSTPSDLAQLIIELQRSNAGLSNQILSRTLTKSMLSPQIENAGLGLVVDGKGQSARFSHSGSNVGYKCFLIGYVEAGQGAVVMTNAENGAQLMTEILRSIAAEYGWPSEGEDHHQSRFIPVR